MVSKNIFRRFAMSHRAHPAIAAGDRPTGRDGRLSGDCGRSHRSNFMRGCLPSPPLAQPRRGSRSVLPRPSPPRDGSPFPSPRLVRPEGRAGERTRMPQAKGMMMTNGMDDWPWTGEDAHSPARITEPPATDEQTDRDAALLAKAGAGLLALALAIALLGPMIWMTTIALALVAGLVLLGAAPFVAATSIRRSALILPFPAEKDRISVKRGCPDAPELLDC